ncbi:MAG TPA: hypothetical protein VGN55_25980 [Xanthobacteraceae bacterium]|jgi:hypothetical protein
MTAMNKLILALAMAATATINLAAGAPAAARERGRMPAYSEGLWKEPTKPATAVEPPAAARGPGIRTEPVQGLAPKPPVLPSISR